MILEGIVTSLNAAGELNVAPMGPIVDESLTWLHLRPFQTSQTFRNLQQRPQGVFHVVDDVLLLAKAAIGKLDTIPETFAAEKITGRVLASACRWYEFEIESLDTTQDRTEIRARVVHVGRLRDVFGFNRAKHAVLEAAILATRLHLLSRDEIERQIAALRSPVEKTAGPNELAAFQLVCDHVANFFASDHSPLPTLHSPLPTRTMILVAGLTPAWQQIAVLDRLRVGEVNRAREVHWCASGKVLNVGLALTQLGASVRTLSMVGSGAAGEATRQDMADLGVDVRWIASNSPQRVCTTLLDRESRQTTEIVENSAPASESERIAFESAFADEAAQTNVEMLILTGSLPTETPKSFYATLLSRVQAPAILDVRGEELLAALPHRPLVVKPNREELGQTVRRELGSDAEVWQAMSEINARGAEWVVVTNGSREVFASRAEERLRFQPPRVNVVNPIGCGDCFTAGLAWALQRGEDMPSAIRTGIAAAAQNAEQLLPARLDAKLVALSLRDRIAER